jgi:DNA-binding LacI/PurR family transcriptional regulator
MVLQMKIKEIADALNISTATVSRVLNNKDAVHPATREKVLHYISLQETPPEDTYELKTIGIVDTYSRHKINSYYLSDILEGADERIHAFQHATMLIHSDQIELEMMKYGRVKAFDHIGGLLWLEPMFNARYADIVNKHHMPCVVINNCEEDITAFLVKSDNYSSAKRAVNFLATTGHRHIAFVGGFLSLTNHKDRYKGYLDGLKAEGMEPDEGLIIDDVSSWDEHGATEGIYRLLGRMKKVDAIVLCSDFLVLGAYKALEARGVSVPDGVSVVSFDDFPLASYVKPSLSSFRQPLIEIGLKAANLLFEIISAERPEDMEPRTLLIHCPFMVRDSIKNKQET